VSFRITKGNVHDTKKFSPLLKESAKRHDIDNVYGEKAYDNRNNFNKLGNINSEPAIGSSIRNNAST
jgi:Transposase DDE domain